MGHEAEAAESIGAGLTSVFTHTVEGIPLPLISLGVALFGIFSAWAVYNKKWVSNESLGKVFGPLYTLVYRKYFFDELYENIIVKIVALKGLFTGFTLFDTKGVDGAVNGVATVIVEGGKAIRRAQTGQLQLYGLFIGIGVAIIGIVVYLFG
jgi:NADH-quinone oxidoreductase subunit L